MLKTVAAPSLLLPLSKRMWLSTRHNTLLLGMTLRNRDVKERATKTEVLVSSGEPEAPNAQ